MLALYLLYRGIRGRRYFDRMTERFGFISPNRTGAAAIWFHAVSVGEVLAAAELIRRIRETDPRIPVFLSTSTLAGRALADQKIRSNVFFAPIDYRSFVKRALRRVRPALVVILETEIWPNLYRESKRAGASLLVVNARISNRALPRYRRMRDFFKHVLSWPDAILAQSEEDARRFREIGAERVQAAGNLKYDFRPPAAIAPEIARFLDRVNPQEVWIAASTMSADIDEDDAVIAAIPPRPGLLTIIVPRKPERFDAVAAKLERARIRFVRRTALADIELPGVLLLDSIGELAALFERADVVFMGGTLANCGGHNILEPAYFGKPVIIGPHMENFAAIADEFRDATIRIASAGQLGPAVSSQLDDPERRRAIGEKARQIALSKRGAAGRILEQIRDAYAQGIPSLEIPFIQLWRTGHAIRRAIAKPHRLSTRVVSIGGLSFGGSGKTPMVAHLAERLREAGRNPAILTRGYGRNSTKPLIVERRANRPVENHPVEETGDEAQIFIRRADAHVGISKNRYRIAREIETKLNPGIFLLDDGFQHVALARDHDIVLINAQDPYAGGLLREPFSALRRADTIILTRASQDTSAVEALIRRHSQAPVFRSRIVPLKWIGLDESEFAISTQFERPGAFCGLGSPHSFWRALDDLNIAPAWRREFRDHHRYSAADLQSLKNAEILLTTQKDAMNLPAGAANLLAPAKLYWLRIGIEIENEDELLKRIL